MNWKIYGAPEGKEELSKKTLHGAKLSRPKLSYAQSHSDLSLKAEHHKVEQICAKQS